eukprot:scaffold120400_cov14-Tisochrysis_lutea.AAC.1
MAGSAPGGPGQPEGPKWSCGPLSRCIHTMMGTISEEYVLKQKPVSPANFNSSDLIELSLPLHGQNLVLYVKFRPVVCKRNGIYFSVGEPPPPGREVRSKRSSLSIAETEDSSTCAPVLISELS